MVDKQAAAAVKKLLDSQASGRHGASLKSLALAGNNQAKKATFKVAYNTLRYLPTIKSLIAASGILETHRYPLWKHYADIDENQVHPPCTANQIQFHALNATICV